MFAALGALVVVAVGRVRQDGVAHDGAAAIEERNRGSVTRLGPTDVWDDTPQGNLVRAAANGDSDILRDLMDRGISPNQADANGTLALHRAAENGHLDAMHVLIEAGAEVSRGDSVGYTPLIWAASSGNAEMVRYLLEQGADPNERFDPNRATALQVLMVAWLLAADVLPSPEGVVLHVKRNERLDIVRTLLAAGADPNLRASDGGRAIEMAAMTGDAEVVRLLLEAGANVSETRVLERLVRMPGPVGELLQEAFTKEQ